jgi:hypothetical protein
MEEKEEKISVCFNHKLPDVQCGYCIWLEWTDDGLDCLNRKKMVCSLYLEELFGENISKTLN